jgi:hypothetical protein
VLDYVNRRGDIVLVLPLLQYFVPIILNSANHFTDEIRRFGIKEPAQRDNAFRNRSQVVEERRCSIGLAKVVDGIGRFLELSHEVWRERLRLLCLRSNIDKGSFRFKRPKDSFRLVCVSEP